MFNCAAHHVRSERAGALCMPSAASLYNQTSALPNGVCTSTHTRSINPSLAEQVLQPSTADTDEQLVSVRETLLTLPEEVIQDVGLEVGAGADAGGAEDARLHACHAISMQECTCTGRPASGA